MKNKTWKGSLSYQVGNFPRVDLVGRKPIEILDLKHKSALLALGVFEEVVPGMIRYSGKAFYKEDDGGILEIDKDGHLPKDKGEIKMSAEKLADIDKEFE